MHPVVFADPKTDFVFKRIFGDEERKPLLIALLNDLLELKGPRRIPTSSTSRWSSAWRCRR